MYLQAEKITRQQYLLHMSLQYGELRPTNGWDRFGSSGHPSKFQRDLRFGFVTAATSLTGGQASFARCLAVCWAATLYIYIFGGTCPLTELCPVQNSHFVQVLRPSLAFFYIGSITAQHSIAAGVDQTLRRGTRNGITELSQRSPPIFGRAAIMLSIGPHSSFFSVFAGSVRYADYASAFSAL